MRRHVIIRSSSATWIAPLAIALALFFYLSNPPENLHNWAPSVITHADHMTTTLSYMLAVGLGAWESGRLRDAKIWSLAPSRSRYTIAASALLPVVAAAWLMNVATVGYALIQFRTWPTLLGIRTLLIPAVLCIAYAVIGFSAGRLIWQGVAAPLLAALIFLVSAFPASMDMPWPRHLCGTLPDTLDFGQAAKFSALWPHILCIGGVSLAVATLWSRSTLSVRTGIAVVILTTSLVGSYELVKGDGYGPIHADSQAPITCLGNSPKMCAPQSLKDNLGKIRESVSTMFEKLRKIGVDVQPDVIADTLEPIRFPAQARVVYASLHSNSQQEMMLSILRGSVAFSCSTPNPTKTEAIYLWASDTVGLSRVDQHILHGDFEMSENGGATIVKRISDTVNKVRSESKHDQAEWVTRTRKAACERSSA